MKKTRIIAMLLLICMTVTLFAACGDKTSDEQGGSSAKPSSNVSDNAGEEIEIEEINFWLHGTTYAEDKDEVYAAINEITESEIGVHVNFNFIGNLVDYSTQLSLAIANRETIDVCTVGPVPTASFITLYSSGALYDITDLLDEEGADIKALFGDEILNAMKVDGRAYGLPNYRLLASQPYMVYRTDALEAAGAKDQYYNMKTWADFEEIMAQITQVGETYAMGWQGNVTMNFVFGKENIYDTYSYDSLGDSLLLVWTDQKGNVDLLYNREDVIAQYKMTRDWKDKGYYYPDSAISTESGDIMVSQNVYAGQVTMSEFGIEIAKKQSMGIDVECLKLASGYINTTTARIWSMAIPASTSNPEAAMKFLNFLYTSPEVMNLLVWGIEDKHYEVNENGEAKYLEGKDASTSGYHMSDYSYGNQFICLPWEGQGGDFRVRAQEDFDASNRSVYCGLSFDTSDYSTMIAALASVKSEFHGQLAYGNYTDSMYDEFMDKLEVAEINDYIALYQAAVDDWMK